MLFLACYEGKPFFLVYIKKRLNVYLPRQRYLLRKGRKRTLNVRCEKRLETNMCFSSKPYRRRRRSFGHGRMRSVALTNRRTDIEDIQWRRVVLHLVSSPHTQVGYVVTLHRLRFTINDEHVQMVKYLILKRRLFIDIYNKNIYISHSSINTHKYWHFF